ncbi:MAG TPA: hypothetical protein VL463_14455 [Kofleriaceae bacterium]|nr:hypothetical protein [Kofleriaceae bacterium]
MVRASERGGMRCTTRIMAGCDDGPEQRDLVQPKGQTSRQLVHTTARQRDDRAVERFELVGEGDVLHAQGSQHQQPNAIELEPVAPEVHHLRAEHRV